MERTPIHIQYASLIVFLVTSVALSEIPSSPLCKPDTSPVTVSDVRDWQQFVQKQVPPYPQLKATVPNGDRSKSEAFEKRNAFITLTYLRLCRENVLDRGSCQAPPNQGFLWTCAAAFGSHNAGLHMKIGLASHKEFKSFSGTQPSQNKFLRTLTAPGRALGNFVSQQAGQQAALAATQMLGEANSRIFDSVAWHHLAAAKCGSDFAARLLDKFPGSQGAQYAAYWRKVTKENNTKQPPALVPDSLRDLLKVEQRLIQPMFEENDMINRYLSQNNMIQSGVPGAPSFKEFSTKWLRVNPLNVNLANFEQRFQWEISAVIPKILTNLLRPQCEGERALATMIANAEREVRSTQAIATSLADFPSSHEQEFFSELAFTPPQEESYKGPLDGTILERSLASH